MLKMETTTKAAPVAANCKSSIPTTSPQREPNAREKAEMMYEAYRNGPLMDEIRNILLDQYDGIILEQGIMALGYGKLPSAVLLDKRMRDPHLLAMLGLICAQAGENNKAIIARSTICNALSIAPHTFAKYMKKLCDYGYVSRYQPKPRRFKTTEYTVNYQAIQVKDNTWVNLKRTSETGVQRKVSFRATNYGNIPKLVMYDERLSVYDKAVYVVLLLMGGASMSTCARRDFVGELAGIKNVDTISSCVKHLDEAGFLLTFYRYGTGRTETVYHVLLKPRDFNYIPESWIKHDCLHIFQNPYYLDRIYNEDIITAIKDYTHREKKSNMRTDTVMNTTLQYQEQLQSERVGRELQKLRAELDDVKKDRREKNLVKRESERAKERLLEKMAAEGKTAEEVFAAMVDEVGDIPFTIQDGSVLYSENGYQIAHGTNAEDNAIAEVLGTFYELSPAGRKYVLSKIAGVPKELCNNPNMRKEASEYAAELLNGLPCKSELDMALAAQIHKTLLDGINHPSRLGYHGKKMNGETFCSYIKDAQIEDENSIVRKAAEAINRTKRKFNACVGDVQAYKAYVRAVFLNKLSNWQMPAFA